MASDYKYAITSDSISAGSIASSSSLGSNTTIGFPNTTQPYHQHQIYSPQFPSVTNQVVIDLGDDPVMRIFLEQLGVEPSTGYEQFVMVIGGVYYSFNEILKAQMDMMFKLGLLLMHKGTEKE